MTATTTAPTVDVTQARHIRAHWDEARRLSWIVASYPGNDTYELQGWSDGTGATCTCPGYRNRQRCRHALAWPLIVAELQRQWYTKHDTADLKLFLAAYDGLTPLDNDQRLAANAIRAVLHARGVRPTATERAATVAKARAAQDDLFGGAA